MKSLEEDLATLVTGLAVSRKRLKLFNSIFMTCLAVGFIVLLMLLTQ